MSPRGLRDLRAAAAAAATAKTDAERKAKEAAIAEAATKEKRRLEIQELRRQGKWKTHEDIEREQRDAEEAYRSSQQGVLANLKDLVTGKR